MSSEFVPFLKGDMDARQHKIYNLPDPVDANEAANKAYVDGGSQPDVAPLQYIDWGPSDTTKTYTIAPGTQMIAAWVVTEEAFETPATFGAKLTLGFDGQLDCWLSVSDVGNLGQMYTVTDLQGGDIDGIDLGFPFANDTVAIFPEGGSMVGTLDSDGCTSGRVRLYFLACVPTEATTT